MYKNFVVRLTSSKSLADSLCKDGFTISVSRWIPFELLYTLCQVLVSSGHWPRGHGPSKKQQDKLRDLWDMWERGGKKNKAGNTSLTGLQIL